MNYGTNWVLGMAWVGAYDVANLLSCGRVVPCDMVLIDYILHCPTGCREVTNYKA